MNAARKTLTAAIAALFVASGALATIGEAEAGQRRHHHKGASAGPVIAGLIGGLAVGALAASASRSRAHAYNPAYNHGYNGGYGYAPAPAYSRGYTPSSHAYVDDYATQCFIQKRRVFDEWGNFAGSRKVRVCQ